MKKKAPKKDLILDDFWLQWRPAVASKGILERYVFEPFRERIFGTFSDSLREDPLWS